MSGTVRRFISAVPVAERHADRTRNTRTRTRQHMYGGTLGNPIIKNKLFSFFSFEDWKVGLSQTLCRRLCLPPLNGKAIFRIA